MFLNVSLCVVTLIVPIEIKTATVVEHYSVSFNTSLYNLSMYEYT